ncbi:hypothetical protein [Nocardia sp. NPDC019395]|uniref:hypothetical protein n=1 Tax=Nocardia sp. NPDC019395 TaxID=3154686 RepID=UPI0033DE3527
MKRISTVVVAAAALTALALSGCSSEEDPAESSGLRKNTATTQNAPETGADTGATGETPAPESDTDSTETPAQTSSPAEDSPTRASDTTCAQFAELDEPEQQQLVHAILGENPDSAFVGNPNAALGTAKLVCNSSNLADQKVAVASGIIVDG